jgi:hypothetical protein
MKTVIKHNLMNYAISDKLLLNTFTDIDNDPLTPVADDAILSVSLIDVSTRITGYGRWKVTVKLEVNDRKITLTKTTTNSMAIDDINEDENYFGYVDLLDEVVYANQDEIIQAAFTEFEEEEEN